MESRYRCTRERSPLSLPQYSDGFNSDPKVLRKGCNFRQLESITSHELEFLVVEMGLGLSLMRCSAWGHFFRAFSVLQISSGWLSVIVRPFERFVAEKFGKGETLSRFPGVEIGKYSDGSCSLLITQLSDGPKLTSSRIQPRTTPVSWEMSKRGRKRGTKPIASNWN